jgi:NAD dependent epimerase/dehydratase family enzyme
MRGPVNAVAPEPVTNAVFTATLARALRRPAYLTVPAFLLRATLGEMANEMLLASARVIPAKLREAGFRFEHPRLDSALDVLMNR